MKNKLIKHYRIRMKEIMVEKSMWQRLNTITWSGGVLISLTGVDENTVTLSLSEKNTFQLKKDLDKILKKLKKEIKKR